MSINVATTKTHLLVNHYSNAFRRKPVWFDNGAEWFLAGIKFDVVHVKVSRWPIEISYLTHTIPVTNYRTINVLVKNVIDFSSASLNRVAFYAHVNWWVVEVRDVDCSFLVMSFQRLKEMSLNLMLVVQHFRCRAQLPHSIKHRHSINTTLSTFHSWNLTMQGHML